MEIVMLKKLNLAHGVSGHTVHLKVGVTRMERMRVLL